jgi:hypothetical protein
VAYDLDGSTNKLSVATAPVTAVPLTLACWFNPDRLTQSETLLGLSDSSASFARIQFRGDVAGDHLWAQTEASGGSNDAAIGSGSVQQDVWQHACAVFASNTSRAVYLNGTGKGTNATNLSMATLAKLTAGITTLGSDSTPFDGTLAELAVWSVALTDDEVLSLARGIEAPNVRPAALEFYAPIVRELTDRFAGLTLTASGGSVLEHPRILGRPRFRIRKATLADTTPPSAATVTIVTSPTAPKYALVLSITAPAENVNYEVRGQDGASAPSTRSDGTQIGTGTIASSGTTTVSDAGLQPGKQRSYKVFLQDAAGNWNDGSGATATEETRSELAAAVGAS